MKKALTLVFFGIYLLITSCQTEVKDNVTFMHTPNLSGKDKIEIFNVEKEVFYQMDGWEDTLVFDVQEEMILNVFDRTDYADHDEFAYFHVKPSTQTIIDTIRNEYLDIGVIGEVSIENAYLVEFERLKKIAALSRHSIDEYTGMSSEDALTCLLSLYDVMDTLEYRIANDSQISPYFKEIMSDRIFALRSLELFDYSGWHEYLVERNPKLPSTAFKEVENFDFSKPNFVTFKEGRRLSECWLKRNLKFDEERKEAKGTQNEEVTWEDEVRKVLGNSFVGDYIVFSSIFYNLENNRGFIERNGQLDSIKRINSNGYFKKKLEANLALWKHLEVGQVAPDIEILRSDDEPLFLSNFKGKKVYIRVRHYRRTRGLDTLKHKTFFSMLKENDVQFLDLVINPDLAIDEDHQLYLNRNIGNMIEAKGGWRRDWMKDYNILYRHYSYHPHSFFMFIDEEGKIVSIDAPRP